MGNEKGASSSTSSYPVQPSANPSAPQQPSFTTMASASAPLMYPPLIDSAPDQGAPPPYSDLPPPAAPPAPAQPKSVLPGPVVMQPLGAGYQGAMTTVVLQQGPAPRVVTFPAHPIHIQCWYCQQSVKTRTKTHATCLTWLLCGVLCGLGCVCGCCLIPFCTTGTQDVVHTCPNCKKYLGIKTRHT